MIVAPSETVKPITDLIESRAVRGRFSTSIDDRAWVLCGRCGLEIGERFRSRGRFQLYGINHHYRKDDDGSLAMTEKHHGHPSFQYRRGHVIVRCARCQSLNVALTPFGGLEATMIRDEDIRPGALFRRPERHEGGWVAFYIGVTDCAGDVVRYRFTLADATGHYRHADWWNHRNVLIRSLLSYRRCAKIEAASVRPEVE